MSKPEFFGSLLAKGGADRLRREAQHFVEALHTNDKDAQLMVSRFYGRERNPSSQDESSQEARLEGLCKFATVNGRLGPSFIQDNFDHLEDVRDIELLMREDEPEEVQDQAAGIAQDLDPRSNKPPSTSQAEADESSKDADQSACQTPQHERAISSNGDGETRHPQRSDSTAQLAKAVKRARTCSRAKSATPKRMRVHTREASTAREDEDLLSGSSFYFAEDVDAAFVETWQPHIEDNGGIVLVPGKSKSSRLTAIGLATFLVCRTGDAWELERVS